MDIKTLEYIHRLLIESADSAEKAYKSARELRQEYEEREEYEECEASRRKTAVQKCREAYNAATCALENFESQEW